MIYIKPLFQERFCWAQQVAQCTGRFMFCPIINAHQCFPLLVLGRDINGTVIVTADAKGCNTVSEHWLFRMENCKKSLIYIGFLRRYPKTHQNKAKSTISGASSTTGKKIVFSGQKASKPLWDKGFRRSDFALLQPISTNFFQNGQKSLILLGFLTYH